jgi:hypothetical protein
MFAADRAMKRLCYKRLCDVWMLAEMKLCVCENRTMCHVSLGLTGRTISVET